jgi:hypothetical protein
MQVQTDLYNRIVGDADDFEIEKARFNIANIDKIASTNILGFGDYCRRCDITYNGGPSVWETLLCSSKLAKEFGASTPNMVAALMTYSFLSNAAGLDRFYVSKHDDKDIGIV